MTTDSKPPQWHPSDALLHRFVDGDLRRHERIAVEAMLASDRDALDSVHRFQHQNILLQALHPPRNEDTMLPASALNLARGLRRRRLVHRATAASIALLALFGAGTAGWHAQGYVERMVRTPVVSVFPTESMPVAAGEEAAQPPRSLPPVPTATGSLAGEAPGWLGQDARRVPVHPPNLQSVGYQLVDGRADLTAYGPVIRFAYTPSEGGDSPRLALTVASFGTDRRSLATTINPQHASLFWQAGPLLYALSGDVAPASLLSVAQAVGQKEPPAAAGESAEPASASGDEKTGESSALPVTPVADQSEPSKEL